MSKENVEIVRQVIAAYSGRGEVRDDLIDPDIEVWESPELPGELAGIGHDTLLRAKQTVSDSFDDWSIEPERSSISGSESWCSSASTRGEEGVVFQPMASWRIC